MAYRRILVTIASDGLEGIEGQIRMKTSGGHSSFTNRPYESCVMTQATTRKQFLHIYIVTSQRQKCTHPDPSTLLWMPPTLGKEKRTPHGVSFCFETRQKKRISGGCMLIQSVRHTTEQERNSSKDSGTPSSQSPVMDSLETFLFSRVFRSKCVTFT